MKIKYTFKRTCAVGYTEGQEITVGLRQVFSLIDLYESLEHEAFHATINKCMYGRTTAKQDHWVYQKVKMFI